MARCAQAQGSKRLPAEMRCFDTAKIYAKAGDGGRGCVAFRREKFVPHGVHHLPTAYACCLSRCQHCEPHRNRVLPTGGPSGGTGGHGGQVWAEVDDSLNSLSSFRHHVHFRAGNGSAGMGSSKHGSNGASITIPVPPGTIIRTSDPSVPEAILAELLQPGERASEALN